MFGNLTPAIGPAFDGAARFFMRDNIISSSRRVYSLSLQSSSFGTCWMLQKPFLLWKYITAPVAVADAQDKFKGKYMSALACTIPSYYEHENLLLEIHTSVRVVIMCQRVWGRGGSDKVVIFTAEQELDGGKGTSFKNSSQESGR